MTACCNSLQLQERGADGRRWVFSELRKPFYWSHSIPFKITPSPYAQRTQFCSCSLAQCFHCQGAFHKRQAAGELYLLICLLISQSLIHRGQILLCVTLMALRTHLALRSISSQLTSGMIPSLYSVC